MATTEELPYAVEVPGRIPSLSLPQAKSIYAVDSIDDESLFSISKMTQILKSGSDSQRTVILFELQQLLEHCFDETLTVLVPVLCEGVPDWSMELQISVAEAVLEVIQKPISKRASKMICDAAFEVVTRTRTEDIFEAWGEILVVLLPNIEWNNNVEISSVIAIIDEFSVSKEKVCRKLVARVLGSFSSCLSTAEVETYVLNRALLLVDDLDVDVRGMVSESLAFIGNVLDVEVIESRVWPKILTLLEDPDARIHAATLRTIAHIAEVHKEHWDTSPLFTHRLPPVFAKECEFAHNAAQKDQRKVDDDTYLLLEIISEVFGPFVFAVHPYLTKEAEKRDAFCAFLAMATCNGPIVRRYCAFNLPGIAVSLGENFKSELSDIAEFLSRDSDAETRWNLAAGMHETTSLLMQKASADNLFKMAVSLLQDENPLVRMNALEHFFELISALTKDGEPCYQSEKKLSPIFQNLKLLSRGNWRTQELLAKQLEKVSVMVPPESLREHVLPLLYRMAEESTYLVRKAVMPAIAKAIWCLPYPGERESAMNTFTSNWGKGGVYWMRIAFIDCAVAAAKFFSANLFDSLFAETLFGLADDPVDNVRLRLAQMIQEVTPSCFSNAEFHKAVEKLRSDSKMDVQETIAGNTVLMEQKMQDMDAFRQENEARETAETELRNQAQRIKAEGRKKVGLGKVRGSSLLPKIGGKLAVSPREEQTSAFEAESPVNVTDAGFADIEPQPRKNGLTLPSVARQKEAVKRHGSGDAPMSPSAPSRKTLKSLLGYADEEPPSPSSYPSSPRRSLKTLLSHGNEDGSPNSGGRKTLRNLLARVGSGFRNAQQQQ